MKVIHLLTAGLMATLLLQSNAYAGFPQDFSDVVFVENNRDVQNWPVTSTLRAGVNGGTITVEHSKRNSWPITNCRFNASERVNASVWGFVRINGVWHAGTWEYLRAGVTTRKTSTYGGPGHFRPPIGTFRPRNGEIYGFMVSGIARDALNCVNARERSNIVLWRWGEGVVPFDDEPEPEPETPTITPTINLLLD